MLKYKLSHILEAQHKDDIGIDYIITSGEGVTSKDVVTIKVRSKVDDIKDFEAITSLFERAVRQHIRNVNLRTNI